MTDRFAILPARAAALKLGAWTFRVVIAIAAYADEGRKAFPSLDTIAKDTGIDRRNVPAEIAKAVEAGLLRREQRKDPQGDFTSTVYEVLFGEVGVMPGDDAGCHAETCHPDMPGDDTLSCGDMTPGVMSGHALTDQESNRPKNRPREQSSRRSRVAHSDISDELLNRFLDTYPKMPHPTSKLAVRKELAAAVKRAIDPERIITAAQAYASTRDGENPRYTKSPVGWLRGGCWDLPLNQKTIDEHGNVVSDLGAVYRPHRSRADGWVAAGFEVGTRMKSSRGSV